MFESQTEIGSFFFQNLLNPHINTLTCQHSPVLRTFLVSLGVDIELCIVRAASYALSKWLISNELGLKQVTSLPRHPLGLKQVTSLPRHPLGFSYATESHGLWILKGYFPILTMKITNTSNDFNKISKFPIMDPKETVLRYSLSHQQAETVVQFDYSVKFHENYIKVNARVDNIRVNVTKLGFYKEGIENENEIVDCYAEERYFPSRVRVWIGPEVGSSNVTGLSLGRSSKNEEREVEVTRVLKGSFGNMKVSPRVKARARMSTRRKMKDWRMEQESDGNAAVLDMVLYDRESGEEVMNVKGGEREKLGFKNVFMKRGGLVFGRDEFGDEIGWRIGREMEGNVLKWRIGGQIWLTYWPNKLNSGFYETRCVEWCDEIDLPLVPTS